MTNQQACKQCGASNPPHHTFCFQCGAALVAQASLGAAAPAGSHTPATQGQQSDSQEDFLSKYGKSIVVITFSLLIGDTLPTLIQKGSDPDMTFFAIVLVTLPYTAAMVGIFLGWMSEYYEYTMGNIWRGIGGSGLLLGLGFLLGGLVHWGISDTERAHFDILRILFHSGGGGEIAIIVKGVIIGIVLILFYTHKYGIQTFIPATLASFVIAWNIRKPKKAGLIVIGVVVLLCVIVLAYFAASADIALNI